jgi:hypothetical protein
VKIDELDLCSILSDYSDSDAKLSNFSECSEFDNERGNVDEKLQYKKLSNTDVGEKVSCTSHCELKKYLFNCISEI